MGFSLCFHGCPTFQNKNHPRSRTLLRLYLSCKSFHLRDRTSRRENPEFLFHSGIPNKKLLGILGVSQILRMIYKSETSEFQVFCKTSVSGFATTLAWLKLLNRWLGALELLQLDLSLHLPTWTNSSLTAYGFEALPLKFLPLG